MASESIPKYKRVKRRLIREIESGRWTSGSLFPSENQLLAELDVSRPTLVRSLQELVKEGYLYRRQGKGTFIADRASPGQRSELSGEFTVFMSRDVAALTGAGRMVQLRILRGIEEALGSAYAAGTFRQAANQTIDAQTRRFIETAPPGVALIIEPGFCPTLRHLLTERGWIVWSINEPLSDGNCVFIDQEHAGYMATRFLLDEGRRRIALVNGPRASYWGFGARHDGYVRALTEAGIAADPALVVEGEHAIDSEAGRMMMRVLLDRGVTIDGVVGASDSKAMGAMAHAAERGVAIPQALAFVSIDNTLADQAQPPLPAVAMPFEEMGYQAATQARSAVERRLRPSQAFTRISLRPTLVER